MLKNLNWVHVPKHCLSPVCFVQTRNCTVEVKQLKNPQTAFLKRGTGGRSSFNGNVVTVFGATGFIGSSVVNQLGKRGAQIIIPHRSDPDDLSVKSLKVAGDLGQVLFHQFNLKDPDSIRRAIKYSNIVINLIGTNQESKNFSYYDVHEKGAREIAKACKEVGVERLIHFSTLNINQKPQRFFLKKMNFWDSKRKGEIAVLNEFPDATIFRPSVVYGYNDHFLWALFERKRSTTLSIPLYKKGEKTIRQPVFSSDVSAAVINAINNVETRGKIYQIVGPERYYLKDIAIFGAQVLQRHVFVNNLVHDVMYDPYFLAKILFYRYGLHAFHFRPNFYLSLEQIEMESVTDEVDFCLPTLVDLGINPAKMEDKVPFLIFKMFQAVPDVEKSYEELLPPDSLSAKALHYA